MELQSPEILSPWDRLDLPRKAAIEYEAGQSFMPSDDKLTEVWLALHSGKECKTDKEQELYDLLTKSLIERAKHYGSLERP